MPRETSDWEQLPVKRIFGTATTYAKAMEKLVLAQETSNIDNSDMSSEVLREREKKRRRIKAKKKFSSSSSDEDIADNNKENRWTQMKTLPVFPEIEEFVPDINEHIHTQFSIHKSTDKTNILSNKTLINIAKNNDEDTNRQSTNYTKELFGESSTINRDKEQFSTDEFNKQVLLKLNKILYKLDILENKLHIVENKMGFVNSVREECNVTFPVSTMSELTCFEEQLQEMQFKNEVLHIFQLVGGSTAHVMIHNMLKKAITNSVALNFSWAGKRDKKSFQQLNLTKIIAQAVRMLHGQVTDTEIADSISKWLAQATLRTTREKSRPAM